MTIFYSLTRLHSFIIMSGYIGWRSSNCCSHWRQRIHNCMTKCSQSADDVLEKIITQNSFFNAHTRCSHRAIKVPGEKCKLRRRRRKEAREIFLSKIVSFWSREELVELTIKERRKTCGINNDFPQFSRKALQTCGGCFRRGSSIFWLPRREKWMEKWSKSKNRRRDGRKVGMWRLFVDYLKSMWRCQRLVLPWGVKLIYSSSAYGGSFLCIVRLRLCNKEKVVESTFDKWRIFFTIFHSSWTFNNLNEFKF